MGKKQVERFSFVSEWENGLRFGGLIGMSIGDLAVGTEATEEILAKGKIRASIIDTNTKSVCDCVLVV